MFQIKEDYIETQQLNAVSRLRLSPVLQDNAIKGVTEPLIKLCKSLKLTTALWLFKTLIPKKYTPKHLGVKCHDMYAAYSPMSQKKKPHTCREVCNQ